MARSIGPKCKKCRKAGEKLFLRGDKCLSDKCVLMKRSGFPFGAFTVTATAALG